MDFLSNVIVYNHNIPLLVNIMVYTANVLNLVYNIPQMYRTYKRKTTCDISGWFLLLRFISSIIWIIYAIYMNDLQIMIANTVTWFANLFIGYYKIMDIYKTFQKDKYVKLNNNTHGNMLLSELVERIQSIKESNGDIIVDVCIINNSVEISMNSMSS